MVQAESDREGIFLVSCGEEFVFCTAMSEETSPAAPLLDSAEAVPVIKLRPRVAQVAGPESPPPAAPELTADSEAVRPPPPPSFSAGVGSAALSDGEVPKFKLRPKSSEGPRCLPSLSPKRPR